MNRKLWISVVTLIILLLVGAAFYSDKKAENIDYSAERQKAIDEIINQPTITINTKHQYKNGEHIFLGFLEVPTPCYTHNVEVKKSPEITEIAVTYTEDLSKTTDVCIQVISERTFKISFAGEEDENIIMTLNGEIVKLNQFEIDPEEKIEDADIFIKG
jgi:hypothetical protein